MGASAAEIDQQIKDTRRKLDANLGVLQARLERTARQVGLIAAAAAVGVAATAGIGFLIYLTRPRRTALSGLRAAVKSTRTLKRPRDADTAG
ncbi:MAG TPA: hypothetical protein VGK42_02420 [Candidatus Dormibacteraeota bacterium]|jgi:hypothetical protein